MKKIIIAATIISFFVAPTISMATLIQETWTGNVNIFGVEAGDYYTDDQLLTMIVTYDDAGIQRHEWTDGINERAEFGEGDDGVENTFNLQPWHDYIGDASFQFDDTTIAFMNSLPDTTDRNESYAYKDTDLDAGRFYEADGMLFFATLLSDDTPFDFGIASLPQGNDGDGYLQIIASNVNVTRVDAPVAPVPEPATMLLFGTGLAGLAGYRRRKAMKK